MCMAKQAGRYRVGVATAGACRLPSSTELQVALKGSQASRQSAASD